MNRLLYSPQASSDLHEIRLYINDELQNATAAINVVSKITKKIRSLMDFPHMGAALSSITNIITDYRYLIYGNYTAFYRYDKQSVYVIRILYGRRDFMKIFFSVSPENNDD